MSSKRDVIDELRGWIAAKNGAIQPSQIADDTPLVSSGLLTSLQVVEFLAFIEELRGSPLELEELSPRTLRDLASIRRAFFGGDAA